MDKENEKLLVSGIIVIGLLTVVVVFITLNSQLAPQAPTRYCGDRLCINEDCSSCPSDCGDCFSVPTDTSPPSDEDNSPFYELQESDFLMFTSPNLKATEYVCSQDYCDTVPDGCRELGCIEGNPDAFYAHFNVKMRVDAKCRVYSDGILTTGYCPGSLQYEKKYIQFKAGEVGTNGGVFAIYGANSHLGKSSAWDAHEVTLCCFAAMDFEGKSEVCITKEVIGGCS